MAGAMTVLRVFTTTKNVRVPAVLEEFTVDDLKAAIADKLGLPSGTPPLRLSLTRGNHRLPYAESLDDIAQGKRRGTTLDALGFARGQAVYACVAPATASPYAVAAGHPVGAGSAGSGRNVGDSTHGGVAQAAPAGRGAEGRPGRGAAGVAARMDDRRASLRSGGSGRQGSGGGTVAEPPKTSSGDDSRGLAAGARAAPPPAPPASTSNAGATGTAAVAPAAAGPSVLSAVAAGRNMVRAKTATKQLRVMVDFATWTPDHLRLAIAMQVYGSAAAAEANPPVKVSLVANNNPQREYGEGADDLGFGAASDATLSSIGFKNGQLVYVCAFVAPPVDASSEADSGAAAGSRSAADGGTTSAADDDTGEEERKGSGGAGGPAPGRGAAASGKEEADEGPPAEFDDLPHVPVSKWSRGDAQTHCPSCASNHTVGGVRRTGPSQIVRDLEGRRVVALDLSVNPPRGPKLNDFEMCQDATVGDLVARLAVRLQVAPQRIALELVSGDGRFTHMDARLLRDYQGPKLKRRGNEVTVRFERSPGAGERKGAEGGKENFDEDEADESAERAGALPRFSRDDLEGDLKPPRGIAGWSEYQEWLKGQFERVEYDAESAVRTVYIDPNPFLEQALQRRRMGWLLGRVDADRNVFVEAIYEPPQVGLQERLLLLDDDNEDKVEQVCAALRLRRVGWIVSQHYRGDAPPLTASEVLFQAQQQARNPHFVTARLVLDHDTESKESYLELDAWQASRQCVSMLQKGQLGLNPDEPNFAKAKKKVIVYNEKSGHVDPTHDVDTLWFHTAVAIKSHEDVMFYSRFPKANRQDSKGNPLPPATVEDLAQAFKRSFTTISMLDRLSDFQLLLFLAVHGTEYSFTMEEVLAMCEMVVRKDEVGANSFEPKCDRAFGLGFRCPICESQNIDSGYFEKEHLLVRHVRASHEDATQQVVCTICASRAADPVRFRQQLPGPLVKHLREEHAGTDGDDAAGGAGSPGFDFARDLDMARRLGLAESFEFDADGLPLGRRDDLEQMSRVRRLVGRYSGRDPADLRDEFSPRGRRPSVGEAEAIEAAARAAAEAASDAVRATEEEPPASPSSDEMDDMDVVFMSFPAGTRARAMRYADGNRAVAVAMLAEARPCPFAPVCEELFVDVPAAERDMTDHLRRVHNV